MALLLWAAYALSTQPVELVAAAVVLAALVAVALFAHLAVHPASTGDGRASVRGAALRKRARSTGVLRQRDPDARGRRRPRAPSGLPSAAQRRP